MKFNNYTKKKLETIFCELGYSIRYGKGSFNSGYCLVKEEKIVVINQFFDTSGRARVLYDLLIQLNEIDDSELSEASLKFIKSITRENPDNEPLRFISQKKEA